MNIKDLNLQAYHPKMIRHNFFVNVMDGGFFGFALGFSSFTTILPLFVSQLTNSALLIGLIPGLHIVGWQLPQLLTAKKISTLKRIKPFVLMMTIHERLPYIGLCLTAWFLPILGFKLALIITFLLLIWQGIGSGLTANAWQNMIVKVIPSENRATFFGMQSALSNLLASIGAIAAGIFLDRMSSRAGYALCFLSAAILLGISFFFLGRTIEPENVIETSNINQVPLWKRVKKILQNDHNFRWFLIARVVSQFGLMGMAFYTVFAVNYHGMSKLTAGFLTSVLLITQVSSNLVMGRMADRWSRKALLEFGGAAAMISALVATFAPNLTWFILVFIMAGLANTAHWTIGLAMIVEFGQESERPTYIGMANTLVAPSALLAPLVGGWLADYSGYKTTFLVAALLSLITSLIFHFFTRDLKQKSLITSI